MTSFNQDLLAVSRRIDSINEMIAHARWPAIRQDIRRLIARTAWCAKSYDIVLLDFLPQFTFLIVREMRFGTMSTQVDSIELDLAWEQLALKVLRCLQDARLELKFELEEQMFRDFIDRQTAVREALLSVTAPADPLSMQILGGGKEAFDRFNSLLDEVGRLAQAKEFLSTP